MSRPIIASHIFDFADILSGWNKISVTAGPSGDLVMLALKQEPNYRQKGGSTSKEFVDKPINFRVHHLTENGWNASDLEETRENMHYAQPLPQNQWVVVRARSGGSTDGNGHFYSATGDLLETVAFGDGIQDTQTTEQGQIWVSYFDEGVFGGSIGSAGLACFDLNGKQTFDFNTLTDGMIADCYALNVVSDTDVWLCPYTDFPIVQLRNRQISHKWDNNPIGGAKSFAVWKDRVLFSGGYRQREKLFVINLYRQDDKELLKGECHAVDASENKVNFQYAFGRGSRLYLVTDESLYFLELQEI